MAFNAIKFESHNHITVLTMNRPEKLNAMNEEMWTEMVAAFDALDRDEQARVLVITGAGRAFCAGGDVSPAARGGEKVLDMDHSETIRRYERAHALEVTRHLRRLEIPVIAMVNGTAAGGGMDLALACDIRLASEKARFIVAFTQLGITPAMGGTWFLPRILGYPKAAEIVFTGDPIDAATAEKLGLINRLVPSADLEKETMALAEKIAGNPPIALRLAKLQMYKALTGDLDDNLDISAPLQTIALLTEDYREGIAALREKRRATFRGR
ncbi:MAG: enoyl-CoA hydratase/isomerase family protein [Chloroflexi bacterium]|nr:enoyl-CoA hydratase/isomerase family protein [Chloroflexota bacterium]